MILNTRLFLSPQAKDIELYILTGQIPNGGIRADCNTDGTGMLV